MTWHRGYGAGSDGRVFEVRCGGRAWVSSLPESYSVLDAYLDFQQWYKALHGEECAGAMGRVFRDGKSKPLTGP